MNCLRNTGSFLSQVMLRCKAQRLVQDLGLIRGSAHIKPAFRPQPTSRRSFVLRKATAATAIVALSATVTAVLSATVTAALNRLEREIVPCTYRSHLVVLSHQEERKHSDAAFAEHKAELVEENLVIDPRDPRYGRVRLIAERIIHAAHRGLGIYDSNDAPMLRVTDERRKWGKAPPHTGHLRGLNWEVFLTENDRPDAGIVPSGQIMVSTGFLDRFKTDDEIAAVLAHELGHVIARHTVDINNIAFLPKFVHDFFSRRMEIEADYIGILLLGAAGFHPQWALVALEKRAKLEERGSVQGNIFVDHPKAENQLQILSEAKTMKEALELYREAIAMDKVTDRYFR